MSCGQLVFAAFVLSIGMLIIDLAPIQQNMMCEDYSNATECPDTYFSQSYFDARAKFVAAAKHAKAEVLSYTVLSEGGVDYTIDVAVVRGSRTGLISHVSGVHGVEGFIGSAIQVKLLSEWNETRADGPTVVFVHAVNPYGFAQLRRFNEHNVDLNRNFFPTEAARKDAQNRDPNIAHYDDLRDLLFPNKVPTLFERYAFLARGGFTLAQHGFAKLKRAFVTGQYHFQQGPYYGGNREERGIQLLREILQPFSSFRDIIAIDVHSGLGPEGVDTLMVDSVEQRKVTETLFPGTAVEDPSGTGPNSGYDITKGMVQYEHIFGKPLVASLVEEFGTVPGIFVARALIMENSAYQLARGSYIHEVTKMWLRDVFYVQKVSFKLSILRRGTKLFDDAWAHLASLH